MKIKPRKLLKKYITIIVVIIIVIICYIRVSNGEKLFSWNQNSRIDNYTNAVNIDEAGAVESSDSKVDIAESNSGKIEDTQKEQTYNDQIILDNNKLNIFFAYVGQADCTIVTINGKTMIIDGGNYNDGKNVSQFIQNYNLEKIDYMVATHADEDHIGGLINVMKNNNVERLLIPREGSNAYYYKKLVEEAENGETEIINPTMGYTFQLDDAKCEILSVDKGMLVQNDAEDNINNSSIVLQITYANRKILFMGDAEEEVEQSRSWDDVDIIKVGHHGSASGTTKEFLNQVLPEYAFIEVGKDNEYNLPNQYTIKRLEEVGAKIYRTDINQSSFWVSINENEIIVEEIELNLDNS